MAQKEAVVPHPDLVQRDALRSSTDEHYNSSSNLEAMMARISAEATAEAGRKRQHSTDEMICNRCGERQRVGCLQGMIDRAKCPNATETLRT